MRELRVRNMTDNSKLLFELDKTRKELLDLSMRNRLLNTPLNQSRSSRLDVVDELSEQVFRHLVTDGKTMSFLPVPEKDGGEENSDEQMSLLAQPEDEGQDEEQEENGIALRHTDDKLQTKLKSEQLQKKLLKLFYDAKTCEEEQGVNILYLAVGFLKWYEDDKSDVERFSPLILIPVSLSRQSVGSRFKVGYTDEEVNTNLSLQERLYSDFAVKIPDVPDTEELSPNNYYDKVEEAIRHQPRWEVLRNNMVLWFFSFSKFLMYRDLDPKTWPEGRELGNHSLVQSIMGEGFGNDPPLCGEDDQIDSVIQPVDMIHVLDADSSQSLVIEDEVPPFFGPMVMRVWIG